MYFVFRYNINKSDIESHSEQRFDNEIAAKKRFFNILAADIDNENYKYEIAMVVQDDGFLVCSQVFDNRESQTEEN